jgi:hypothetical protein
MSESNSFPKVFQSQSDLASKSPADETISPVENFPHIWRKTFTVQNIFIVLALLCVVVLFGILMESGFAAAMCLFTGIFLLPVISRELRQSKNILFGYWFVVVLHQIVAFTNIYLFATPGSKADAYYIHIISKEIAIKGEWSFDIGHMFYTTVLGQMYRLFGVSKLFGEQLSILVFALSCIVLLKIMKLLNLTKYNYFSLLAFGALPTMVFFGSITIREPYQVFFFMLATYFGIKMHMKGGINIYFIAFIMSAIIFGFFHKGLLVYAICLMLLFFIWSHKPVSSIRNVKKLRLAMFIFVPIIIVGVIALFELKLPGAHMLYQLTHESWLLKISEYRAGGLTRFARANYGIPLDLSSSMMTIYTGTKLYIYYLFAPFPWQVKNFMDVYAGMESIFRLILICFSVKHWLNAKGSQRRLLGLMLILYFSSTFLFAAGTINFGTAIRHNMVSWWIIVIVGVPPLMERLSCIRFWGRGNKRKHFSKPLENIS